MADEELVHRMERLHYVDMVTVRMYDAALERVTDERVREDFERFRRDHQRDMESSTYFLTEWMWAGGEPPEDFRRPFEERLERVSSARHEAEVVQIVDEAEHANLDVYRQTLSELDPDYIRRAVAEHVETEERHVVELDDLLPEKAGTVTSTGVLSSGMDGGG